jgi:hypothetical protein
MKMALNLFMQNGGLTIVETGTAKHTDDAGAGRSTDALSDFAEKYSKDFQTVDIFAGETRRISEDLIKSKKGKVSFIQSDSVVFLQGFEKSIDFLYLDSYDYPAHQVAMAYNKNFNIGWQLANEASYEDVLARCESIIRPCQEHCLKEMQTAYDKLPAGAPILIDDSSLAGGGKSRLAKSWLLERGHRCIYDQYQTLWVK